MRLLTIIGTRPEAVKMAPVLRALSGWAGVVSLLATTGQHRDLVNGPLGFFGLAADFDLELMEACQGPLALVERAIPAIESLLAEVRPDRVIVQGDTASALAGAEAARRRGVPVAHVEAGLRTHRDLPWPEEPFRRAIDAIAGTLFAPTVGAALNLAAENVSGTVHITGNSGIDALRLTIERLAEDRTLRAECDAAILTRGDRPLLFATLHRRENVGEGAREVCAALSAIADAGIADIVFPVHPNPEVSVPIHAALSGRGGIHLLAPLSYPATVRLMQRCDLILTDSGGLQEEAPSLGKPVLVLRDVTERPEGIELGLATLVGARREAIIQAVKEALARPFRQDGANPYGDGRAAERIAAILLAAPFEPFQSSSSSRETIAGPSLPA